MSLSETGSKPFRQTRLTWLGHSTVLIEVDGVRVLTDPVLRHRVLHLSRRTPIPAVDLERIDAVLVSHVHWDHLDRASLRRIGERSRVILPRGAGSLVSDLDAVEVEAGDRTVIGKVEVRATHAEHEIGRWRGRRTSALGFVIRGSRNVYFAGDTDLFERMRELPPLDAVLLPVGGWGPSVPKGHLNPQRAAEALTLLKPRFAVPIHWGTFAPMFWRRHRELAADEFKRYAASLAPDVHVCVLRIGGSVEL